jgi:hypothetical protein
MKKFRVIGVHNNELKLKEVKTGEIITSKPDELEIIDNEFFVKRREKRVSFITDIFISVFCYLFIGVIATWLVFGVLL